MDQNSEVQYFITIHVVQKKHSYWNVKVENSYRHVFEGPESTLCIVFNDTGYLFMRKMTISTAITYMQKACHVLDFGMKYFF